MSYMTRYDMVNIKQFKEGKQSGYLCSMCGQYSILPDSVSHQGYNLVCMKCIYKIGHILNDMSPGYIIEQIHQKGLSTNRMEENNEEKTDCKEDPHERLTGALSGIR